MTLALVADAPPLPFFVDVIGGMVVAGVFGAVGIAWLGCWLISRSHPKPEAAEKDGP